MAEQYQVDYLINVKSDAAVTAITNFKTAVSGLMGIKDDLDKFEKMLRSKMDVFKEFNMTMKPKIETRDVEYKIDRLIKKMQTLHGLTNSTLGTIAPPANGGDTVAIGNQNQTKKRSSTPSRRTPRGSSKMPLQGVTSYRVFGPSMLDSGGVTAVDFMKGMGVAYGISGLGTLIGQAISESVDYDNIMQTTKNILAAHDKATGFESRFSNMERQVRDVGVKTKFTSAEVAGASKFLAMAGFNVKDINQSIAPIANIALVGDTEIGETADLVTNIMTGYGIASENIRNAADVMTMTFTKSNTTLTEIAEAYKYSASLLHAGKVPFEISTAALGILGDAGIKGSQAGTTMRTIMSNIVYPRGKKAEKWKEIGVSRYDSNGNVRPILDIFEDLKSKNLSLDDYYAIFDKTAAQGAVSLVNAVDKWNEIVELNFLSSGITDKLAKEKQNTIAGLWAQLTSAFIENGLKTFEALEMPIKKLLTDTTKWLTSQEALDMLTMFGTTLIDLLKTLKEIALTVVGVYQKFKPVVDLWIKFQIATLPFLATGRVVKGLSTMVMWVTRLALGLRATYKTIAGINNLAAMGTLKTYLSSVFNLAPFYGAPGKSGFNNSILAAANKSRRYDTSPDSALMQRYNARYNNHLIAGRIGVGVLGAAGSIAGGIIGSELTGGSGLGSFAGSLIGGGISTLGSGLLASKFGAASVLSGAFGGWLLAGAAIAGIAKALYNTKTEIDASTESLYQYIDSTKKINGIDYSDMASDADKYYQIIYNKQLNVNQELSKHIQLLRERAGLEASASQSKPDVLFKDVDPENYGKIIKASKGIGDILNSPLQAVSNLFNGRSKELLNGAYNQDKWLVNGVNFKETARRHTVANWFNTDDLAAQYAIANLMTAKGRNTDKGTEAYQIIQEYEQRFLRAGSLNDILAIQRDLNSRLSHREILSGSERWTKENLAYVSDNDVKKNYHYVMGLQQAVDEHFNSKESPFYKIIEAYKNMLKEIDSIGYVKTETLSKFAYLSGVGILNPENGAFGSPAFMRKMGFYDNQWHATKIEGREYAADEAKQTFQLFRDELIKLFGSLSPSIQSYISPFISHPAWDAGNTASNDPKIGSTTYYKNKAYKFELRSPSMFPMWYPSDGTGNPLSNKALQDSIHNQSVLQNAGSSENSSTPQIRSSSYSSPYKSTSPAPKQVIVRIENLMNVESIDLSNKDNEAVIDNIKSQLSQALIDVVHDFDQSYHG
jgi:TP901 family phage tail tape measure protein